MLKNVNLGPTGRRRLRRCVAWIEAGKPGARFMGVSPEKLQGWADGFRGEGVLPAAWVEVSAAALRDETDTEETESVETKTPKPPHNQRRNLEAEQAWRKLVIEQEGSGLSMAEFARRKQVGINQFYEWRTTLRRRDREAVVVANRPSPSVEGKPAFVPVRLTEAVPLAEDTFVEVVLPGGLLVRVRPGTDMSLLKQLIRTLGD